VHRRQAEKKVQWQAAAGEGDLAAAKEELKQEEEEESSEEEEEEINGILLPQDLSKLDVAALTPLTPEVIRSISQALFLTDFPVLVSFCPQVHGK